jgi:4-amino-4-deoxy-L-arabinose transferase-like glycosyltransferase
MVFRQNFPSYPLLIFVIAAILFLPFLGNVHLFDWDEINFAESAREMLATGNYRRVQIDYQPFWEKPPLFFWLQTLAMSIFGVGEYAARLPNAIFGILTMLSIYYIGKKHYNEQLGVLWAMCYAGSILPHFYFKSGIIDPVFNFFIFTGLYFLAQTLHEIAKRNLTTNITTNTNIPNSAQNKSLRFALFAGILIGLAILTKGPVGFLVPLLCYLVYAITQKFRYVFAWKEVLIFAFSIFFISLFWFGLDIWENGIWFLSTFIAYQIELFTQPVAGHDQPFYYHFVVLFFGCFPISIIALPYLFPFNNLGNNIKQKTYSTTFNSPIVKNASIEHEDSHITDNNNELPLQQWLLIMFWVVLILFSLSTTKIVHYSSLTYYPLTFLAALRLADLVNFRDTWTKRDTVLLATVGTIIGLLFVLLPIVGQNIASITPLIKDDFAVANMQAKVSWQWYESMIGLLYWFAILYALWQFQKSNYRIASNILLPATSIFMFVALYWIVPKIERYTQGSIIDFYKTLEGKNVYIHVLGFKSYAHYFYPRISPNLTDAQRKLSRDTEWLQKGAIDKPVYFITKVVSTNELATLRALPAIQEIRNENGFVIFFRNVEKPKP